MTTELDELRAQAEGLGIEVDGRWSEATLKERIAQVHNTASVTELASLEGETVAVVAPEARPQPTEAKVNPNTIVYTGEQASLQEANQKQREQDASVRDQALDAAKAAGEAAYEAVTKGHATRNRHAARKAARRLDLAGV
ncbi:MAG: hypothetical protein QNJ62_06215 [Methyloceanibacter sp.]|nr:hypothetical protein [Methyloceanibacter sp.]